MYYKKWRLWIVVPVNMGSSTFTDFLCKWLNSRLPMFSLIRDCWWIMEDLGGVGYIFFPELGFFFFFSNFTQISWSDYLFLHLPGKDIFCYEIWQQEWIKKNIPLIKIKLSFWSNWYCNVLFIYFFCVLLKKAQSYKNDYWYVTNLCIHGNL